MKLAAILPVLVLALPFSGSLAFDAPKSEDSPIPHPHFRKKIEVDLSREQKITISHITVPYNPEQEKKVKPGAGWHNGNAHVEFGSDTEIGGIEVPAGRYALRSRRTDDGWELVLDTPGRFSNTITDEGSLDLETTYSKGSEAHEHLLIDIVPAGDEEKPKAMLEVRFDKHIARVEIGV